MRWQWRKTVFYLLMMVVGAALYHLLLQFTNFNQIQSQSTLHRVPKVRPGGQTKKGNRVTDFADGEKLVSNSFHFPQPHYSKPDKILLRSPWVHSLKKYLDSVNGKQISLVTSSREHTDVLLNWLISAYIIAQPPLDNVLVLSMDWELHNTLENHGFSSLFVSAEMVISPRANITRVFSQVHIVRLTVLRLINHLGFDVANYDCDAIVLKNPQKLFDSKKDVDLFGSFGRGPITLYRKWGVTLNTGVMLLRANPQIEFLWETMAKREWTTTDDQNSINLVLDSFDIKWIELQKSDNIEDIKHDILGVVRMSRPKFHMFVSLFSFEKVCRRTCSPEKRQDYYVWHALAIGANRTVVNKMNQAKMGEAWFLSSQWEELTIMQPTLQHEEWLRFVMNKDTCHWTQSCLP